MLLLEKIYFTFLKNKPLKSAKNHLISFIKQNSVKTHVFRVKNFDTLITEILKYKQEHKILLCKKLKITKNTKF